MSDPVTCGCAQPGSAGSMHPRLCDYCGEQWLDPHCPHDSYQNPCPECDVMPLVQLPRVSAW